MEIFNIMGCFKKQQKLLFWLIFSDLTLKFYALHLVLKLRAARSDKITYAKFIQKWQRFIMLSKTCKNFRF
jgi:hypothetical protein